MKERKFKREKFDTYIVISNEDDTKHIATFIDKDGKFRFVKITSEVRDEFIKQKKIVVAQKNRFKRHIEHSFLTEYKLNERLLNKDKGLEETFLADDGARNIIREIWNLPVPQNRRVYMNIVNGFSLTEIAKIEKCSVTAIHYSIKQGMNNLRKKLKNF